MNTDRFKFRLWDLSMNRMEYDVEECHDYRGCSWDSFSSVIRAAEKEIVILMACTGLKDKNGKLIYESDILLTDKDDKLIVIFHEETASFIFDTKLIPTFPARYVNLVNCEKMEIIGNLYEHPELLERK